MQARFSRTNALGSVLPLFTFLLVAKLAFASTSSCFKSVTEGEQDYLVEALREAMGGTVLDPNKVYKGKVRTRSETYVYTLSCNSSLDRWWNNVLEIRLNLHTTQGENYFASNYMIAGLRFQLEGDETVYATRQRMHYETRYRPIVPDGEPLRFSNSLGTLPHAILDLRYDGYDGIAYLPKPNRNQRVIFLGN